MSSTSKKTVTFSPVVTGIEVLSIYNFTQDEKSACWYDDEETIRIAKRCYKLLRKLEIQGTTKYCIRGLEGQTKSGSIAKRNARSAAIAAVLTEQSDEQADEHSIANMYRRRTFLCQVKANTMAMRDREVADAIHFLPGLDNTNEHDATCSSLQNSHQKLRDHSRIPQSRRGSCSSVSIIRRRQSFSRLIR